MERTDREPKRKDDSEENRVAWRSEARRGRGVTIFWSAIVAGLVSLFIGRAIEASSTNRQVELSRTNCHAIVDVADVLAEVAGDVATNAEDADVKVRWEGYQQTFKTAVPPRSPTCEALFPKRGYIPFLD